MSSNGRYRNTQASEASLTDWPKVGRNTCTSARVITALCDLIDGRAGAGMSPAAGESDFPDLFPRPMQSAQLEAEELGLPIPYIWDIS